jgi:CHRD domain
VRKLIALLAVGAVAALVFSALSSAKPRAASHTLKATLNAAQEVPKQAVKDTAAKGTFTGTLVGTKLTWKLTYSGLTGAASAAHIHLGAMGQAGNVVVPLCPPCKSGMTGTATISKSLWNKIEKHLTYVNVHTGKNPAGEIRGQLAVIDG